MITSAPACARIASVIAAKSSISYDGTPSGARAWMWICDAPSSTARRASAAYSSGVYGIAGHCSRFATAPEIEQLRITGSSKWLIGASAGETTAGWGAEARPSTRNSRYARGTRRPRRSWAGLTRNWRYAPPMGHRRPFSPPCTAAVREWAASYGHHPVALPWSLSPLLPRHPEAADDGRPSLAGVDDVVDQVVPGREVGV